MAPDTQGDSGHVATLPWTQSTLWRLQTPVAGSVREHSSRLHSPLVSPQFEKVYVFFFPDILCFFSSCCKLTNNRMHTQHFWKINSDCGNYQFCGASIFPFSYDFLTHHVCYLYLQSWDIYRTEEKTDGGWATDGFCCIYIWAFNSQTSHPNDLKKKVNYRGKGPTC